jgi:hypothetical protein
MKGEINHMNKIDTGKSILELIISSNINYSIAKSAALTKLSAFESEIHPSHKIYDFMQEEFRTCGGHYYAGCGVNNVNRCLCTYSLKASSYNMTCFKEMR